MSKYHIGEQEYKEIKKRIDLLWDLILCPNNNKAPKEIDQNNKNIQSNSNNKAPNISELIKLTNIATVYEDKKEWNKYKEKFWEALFKDLKKE